MTEEPPTVRRQPWWLPAVLLVVAAAAGLGAGALIWAGDSPEAATPDPYPSGFLTLTPEQYDRCIREVTVSFDGDSPDQEMQRAAAGLRNDQRFDTVRARTRQESFEEFKRVFADQPELLRLTGPDSLPAAAILTVRPGLTGAGQVKALEAEFPGKKVTSQAYCPRP